MKLVLLVLMVSTFSFPTFAWVVSSEQDKMTDEKWQYLSTKSISNVWKNKKAELIIAYNCTKDITRIYISHPFLVSSWPVEIRLDKLPKEDVYASASVSSKVLFIGDDSTNLGSISSSHPKNLIKKWEDHKKILIQYKGISKSNEIAEFNIEGLKNRFMNPCK